MEPSTIPDAVLQALAAGIQHVVSQIGFMKTDFESKLAAIAEQSVILQRGVDAMGIRISRLEEQSELDDDWASARSPQSQVNRQKLRIEIQMLQEKVRVLSDENTKLRNGKTVPYFPLRGVPFDASISDDNRSLSSIQLAERSQANRAPHGGQRIREFRLDSAPSQSFKPNNSLLSDPRVTRMLNNDVFSSKNSAKEVTSLKTGRLAELGQKLLDVQPHPTAGRLEHTPSLEARRPLRVETPRGNRKPKAKNLTIINRRPVKQAPEKEGEEVGKTMATSADERSKALTGIKNFGDFRTLLKQMKDTISFSNYSLFNADVDKSIESLQAIFRDYSELQDKIEALYLRYANHCVESPGLSMSPEGRFDDQRPTGNAVYGCETADIEVAIAIKNLKDNIRLSVHRERLAEVQGNPSHLDSFLYRLKAEFEANGKEYERIWRQVGAREPRESAPEFQE